MGAQRFSRPVLRWILSSGFTKVQDCTFPRVPRKLAIAPWATGFVANFGTIYPFLIFSGYDAPNFYRALADQ
jgi:hypothetical protein